MQIKYICKGYNEGERLERIMQNKLAGVARILGNDDAVATVKLTTIGNPKEKPKFTMEISVESKGKTIRASETSYNMWDNPDKIIPKLENQISKFKNRKDNLQKFVPQSESFRKETESSNVQDYSKIVKTKKFHISIITVEQAVVEMDLLGHDFYIFIDAETNRVSVLYKREDGNLGLIAPEY